MEFSLTKENSELYIIKVEGFDSENDARAYNYKLWAGLKWCLLNLNLPSETVIEPQDIEYYDDPLQMAKDMNEKYGTNYSRRDGQIYTDKPAIYESGKEFSRIFTVTKRIHSGVRGDVFIKCVLEGMSFPNSEEVVRSNKLKVALDLYNAYFTENSDNARFLTLIMVLEALATGKERPPFIKELISE